MMCWASEESLCCMFSDLILLVGYALEISRMKKVTTLSQENILSHKVDSSKDSYALFGSLVYFYLLSQCA